MMNINFETVSGESYVVDGDTLSRMVDGRNTLTGNGEPNRVFQFGTLEVGEPAVFLLNTGELDAEGNPTAMEYHTDIVASIVNNH